MNAQWRRSGLAVSFLISVAVAGYATATSQSRAQAAVVTLKGSMVCNGACLPDPKAKDHGMVVFAIDGTPAIRAEVNKIMKEFYPDKGLDGEAAQKLMDQFSARLKYHIAPDSPALRGAKNTGKNHYCQAARASAVTGVVTHKDGKKWITATRIEATKLKFPDKMLAADKPFVMPGKQPINSNPSTWRSLIVFRWSALPATSMTIRISSSRASMPRGKNSLPPI
jgi:hypothetical protein